MGNQVDLDILRAALARRLHLGSPSHTWKSDASSDSSGCLMCPVGSPFRWDRASHLYVIEEEIYP